MGNKHLVHKRGKEKVLKRLWEMMLRKKNKQGPCVCVEQCDQIGRFIGLWATLKAFGNN